MSKKIISMLLAVVMLFSVVAVSASAAAGVPAEWVGIVVKSDAVIGQKAGTKVHVNVSLQFPEDFDNSGYMQQVGAFVLAWNNAKYALADNGAKTCYTWNLVNPDGDAFLKQSKPTRNANTLWKKMAAELSNYEEDKFGWNDCAKFLQAFDQENQDIYLASTGYAVDIDGTNLVNMLTVTFVVQDTLTADDIIGVSKTSVNGGTATYATTVKYQGASSSTSYAASAIKTEYAKPAPTEVADKTVQIKDNTDGTYSLGFVGTFCMAPEFDATTGKSATIKALGVDVKKNGVAVGKHGDFETNYAYEDSDNGGYKFRAVFPNLTVAANGDDVITVKMYAVMSDGTTVYSNGASTTLNDQLARVGW